MIMTSATTIRIVIRSMYPSDALRRVDARPPILLKFNELKQLQGAYFRPLAIPDKCIDQDHSRAGEPLGPKHSISKSRALTALLPHTPRIWPTVRFDLACQQSVA